MGKSKLNVTLRPFAHKWLKETGNASEAIEKLVMREILCGLSGNKTVKDILVEIEIGYAKDFFERLDRGMSVSNRCGEVRVDKEAGPNPADGGRDP